MTPKIYIDGQSGTTGLQIYDRLSVRNDIELLKIDPEKRHDTAERKKLINEADVVFLCLPDDAAVEAVTLVENPNTCIIDASTAHRTDPDWTYGFPEIKKGQREKIKAGKRIANPGCHASGFLASATPLVSMGILPETYPLTCYSLTGYSGGGKKMIAEYEAEEVPAELTAPRIYGLTLKHKHLKEMTKISGLSVSPVFNPVVDDYYKGMATTILLHNELLNGKQTAESIHAALSEFYKDETMVRVMPFGSNGAMIAANTLAGKDYMEIFVCGNEEQTMVTALFDNLGKGASGAAVQNMNIVLGFNETAGLSV